jgi:hypothetical protein
VTVAVNCWFWLLVNFVLCGLVATLTAGALPALPKKTPLIEALGPAVLVMLMTTFPETLQTK